MALVSLEEFARRVPNGVLPQDEDRASAAIEDASALIRDEGSDEWSEENAPEIVKTICLTAAKRSFMNPDAVRSEAIDGYSTTYANPEVHLTSDERKRIRRAAGRLGAGSVSLTADVPTPEDWA